MTDLTGVISVDRDDEAPGVWNVWGAPDGNGLCDHLGDVQATGRLNSPEWEFTPADRKARRLLIPAHVVDTRDLTALADWLADRI